LRDIGISGAGVAVLLGEVDDYPEDELFPAGQIGPGAELLRYLDEGKRLPGICHGATF
jgi:hypothetical protein